MSTAAVKTTRRAIAASPELGAALKSLAKRPTTRRVVIDDTDQGSGQASTYFTNKEERTGLRFVSSGCAVLDAALGGGWVLGRCANIVGDKSAGKTLLAIELSANFHRTYPEGYIRYNEAESAFDQPYAEALGMPRGVVDFKGRPIDPKDEEKYAELLEDLKALPKGDSRERESIDRAMKKLEAKGIGRGRNTIEALHDDLVYTMDQNKGRPILYIIDSLDALSDDAEQERDMGEASYGGSKPKKMGELFRRLVERMEKQEVLFVVISQLRDKLNVTFGEKQTRSGGRALDFYASHVVWLAEIQKMQKTMGGVDRVIGVKVRARVKKNKVGLPFRECEYPILFGYGVDDLTSCVEWLIEVKREARLDEVDLSKGGYKVSLAAIRDKGGTRARDLRTKLTKIVWDEWQRIETGFLPKASKY